jgi:predicted nucleic acid-binding protein
VTLRLLLDTSVIVASLDGDEPHHAACDLLLSTGGHVAYAHALSETFAVLTGGKPSRRLRPAFAVRLIEDNVLPFVELIHLTGKETLAAITQSEARGVRGGAVYDLLHLAAARKAGAAALITLDARDFRALSRPGDPEVRLP